MQIFLLGVILGKENSMSKGSRVKKEHEVFEELKEFYFGICPLVIKSSEEDYMRRDVGIFTSALFEEAKKEEKGVKKSENNLHV